jgi:ribosome recycling factor
METDLSLHIEIAEEAMQYALEHLKIELEKLRTGKVSPSTFSGVTVTYYGVPTQLNQVATISAADARTIIIQPWEKKMLSAIEKAIFEAGMGYTPQNDGQLIRINIPPLTEERRKILAKQAKHAAEETKIGIRKARREAMEAVKKEVKAGYPEDAGKKREAEVQAMTERYEQKADKLYELKEKDIMTV